MSAGPQKGCGKALRRQRRAAPGYEDGDEDDDNGGGAGGGGGLDCCCGSGGVEAADSSGTAGPWCYLNLLGWGFFCIWGFASPRFVAFSDCLHPGLCGIAS